MTTNAVRTTNSTIDIAKFVMAILVVAIHTEPFAFNIWFDRGFGIITRLCVPFFFIAGAYFFFGSNRSLKAYLTRILTLYFIWTIIYFPFDINKFRSLGIARTLRIIFWDGERVFWYLLASAIATCIVVFLKQYFSNKAIVAITFGLLVIGCIASTYSPLIEKIGGGGVIALIDHLGTRNGLFYAPAYVSLGMVIRENDKAKYRPKKNIIGFAVSMSLLVVESFVFVVLFNSKTRILWLAAFPASYYLFKIILGIKIEIPYAKSVFVRHLSTLIYVSHELIMIVYGMPFGVAYFLVISVTSIVFGTAIITMSRKIKILKYLY